MISLCNFKAKFIIYFIIYNVCEIYVRADDLGRMVFPSDDILQERKYAASTRRAIFRADPGRMVFPSDDTPQERKYAASTRRASFRADAERMVFPSDDTMPTREEVQEIKSAASTPTPIVIDYSLYEENELYTPYDAHDHFSWKFLNNVLEKEKSNVVVSPFSVKVTLAMLAEAAGDNTQTQRELLRALEVTELQDSLRVYYKDVLNQLKKRNPFVTLNLETKLFCDQRVKPGQSYAILLSDFYDTDIERLKFSNAPASAERINSWCENVTNGKLTDLVTTEDVENSVLILINAIYFKAFWFRKFDNTYDGLFFTTPETTLPVQYMKKIEYFYYYNDSLMGAEILRLPYDGKTISMFILLPNTKVGIEELIKRLQGDQIKRMQSLMKEIRAEINVPKFKFEYQTDLKNTFSSLGINAIFTHDASLPGLDGSAQGALTVSKVIQKAGIGLNENGTEAFAATASEYTDRIGSSVIPKEINVDRPFIFFIEEESTDSIIFAGKVLKPAI